MFRSSLFFLAGVLAVRVCAAEPTVFTIKTLPAQMRYDLTELVVLPGADVKIIFENPDDMPHNIVFFQEGTDVVAVCNKQMEKPEEALKRNWLPEDPRMWLHSTLLNPKQKEELVFKAPAAPGAYPFVCTSPGHALTMQGRLKVSAPGPKLTDLKFQMYLGSWKNLPDFSKLTVHREGPLAGNLVEIKLDDYKNEFGVVYTGKLNARSAGDHTFAIAGDDGVRLLIDGKQVLEQDGIHPATTIKEAKVKLAAGEHFFRLEYFQAAGQAELFAAWKGPDFSMTPLSKWTPEGWRDGASAPKKDENVGMPLVVAQEPVIYRNFIQGADNRSIGVGYPGGANIAWSTESFNLALVWRGAFMDAARHWKDRGAGAQSPLGYDVIKPAIPSALPFNIVTSPGAAWPTLAKGKRAEGYQWKGYRFDAKRIPTFMYEWNGLKVSERFETTGDVGAGSGKLVRTVTLSGPIPANTQFLAAAGSNLAEADGGYSISTGSPLHIAVEGATIAGKNLLVPARNEIRITYSWAAMHVHGAH